MTIFGGSHYFHRTSKIKKDFKTLNLFGEGAPPPPQDLAASHVFFEL